MDKARSTVSSRIIFGIISSVYCGSEYGRD